MDEWTQGARLPDWYNVSKAKNHLYLNTKCENATLEILQKQTI